MRFELFVALRYLKAKRRQAAISVITLISVLGVMAGVAALVIALAINNGFQAELQKRLLGATANVNLIRPANDGIRDYDGQAERLSRLPHVVAAAPALYEEVLISTPSRAQGVVLKGVDPQREVRVGDLLTRLREGRLEDLEGDSHPKGAPRKEGDALSRPGRGVQLRPPPHNHASGETPLAHDQNESRGPAPSRPLPQNVDPIIVGKELAKSLGVFVGDTVLVTSPQGYSTPFGIVPKFRRFRVVGVFDSGFYDLDAAWAFTNLGAAQRLFDLASIASVIGFKVDNVDLTEEIAAEIRRAAGRGFETTTWMEQNRSLLNALRLERLVTILTIGLIVVVAALNIFITLVMMVMEKNRDIAVLMSIGSRKRQIWSIFALYGLLIGAVGTLLGLLVGYGVSWAGERYKLIPLQADIYALASVPFHPRAWDGAFIGLAALAISFLATLYPSMAAARLDPAEILRYE